MVSNPAMAKLSGILEVTISEWSFLSLHWHRSKITYSCKQAPTYFVMHSIRNYKADQFAIHIPCDTVDLRDSVADRLDMFNELFLACLENHAPVRTVKIRQKPNPFITEDIRDMKERVVSTKEHERWEPKTIWKLLGSCEIGWKWRYERQNGGIL